MSQELAARTALVTGGASGIGAVIARSFVRAGAKVLIADVNSDLGESLADELGEPEATFEQLDVRSSAQVIKVVAHARFIIGVELPIDEAKAAGVMTADRYRLDFPPFTMSDDLAESVVDAGTSEVV